MPMNDYLYERAMEAITALFNDTTVPKSETRENLETLIGEIQIMLETLGE